MAHSIDAGLRLLDLQILDLHDIPVAKVDDLELTLPDGGGPPYVTAVLTGPLAFGRRLGGRLGRWWESIGARLQPRRRHDPGAHRLGPVRSRGDGCPGRRATPGRPRRAATGGMAAEHLIGRIPGARQ